MATQKHFFFLLLVLFLACALCSCESDPSLLKPQPGFDYFLLSLQWPNALCTEAYVNCRPSPPAQQYFTVHGLWPQNRGSTPTDCEAEAVTDEILVELKDDLMKYWPRLYSAKIFEYSKKLWRDQWSKHGSCSSNKFSPKEYFERGIALGEEYHQKILTYLEDGGIKPDGTTEYTSAKVLKAINQGMTKKVSISCTKDKNDKLQLSEVRLCFDDDAKTPKDCTQTSFSCKGKFIFASEQAPPPSSTHASFLGLMEVEEAVGL